MVCLGWFRAKKGRETEARGSDKSLRPAKLSGGFRNSPHCPAMLTDAAEPHSVRCRVRHSLAVLLTGTSPTPCHRFVSSQLS